jgi:hypothetical protein
MFRLFSPDDGFIQPIQDEILTPITFFKTVESKWALMQGRSTWAETVEDFATAATMRLGTKTDARLVSPTTFINQRRAKAGAGDSGMMFFDCDGGIPITGIVEWLTAQAVEAVIYASARNSPEVPKWRLMLPLARLADRHVYARTTRAIERLIMADLAPDWPADQKRPMDRTKLNSDCLFYRPAIFARATADDGTEFVPEPYFQHLVGTTLRAEAWIDAADQHAPVPSEPEMVPRQEYSLGRDVTWQIPAHIWDKYLRRGHGRNPGRFSFAVSAAMSAINAGYDVSESEVLGWAIEAQRCNPGKHPHDAKGLRNLARDALARAREQVPDPAFLKKKVDWSAVSNAETEAYWRAQLDGEDSDEGMANADAGDRPFSQDDGMRDDPPPRGDAQSEAAKPRKRTYFDEYELTSDIIYWDEDKLFPRISGGYTVLILGRRGSHKTSVMSQLVMDAVLGQGARAIYVPCEGQHFFGKVRMPAYCRARGIQTRELRGRFECIKEGINLTRPGVAERFIADNGDFMPDFVIIDTLAQASPGVETNSSAMGDLLGQDGPVRKIRDAFDCVVIVLCHPPGSNPTKVAGHTSIEDNSEEVLLVEFDPAKNPQITVTVQRYKDGPEGDYFLYRIDPEGVPVPKRVPKEEMPAKTYAGVQPRDIERDEAGMIAVYLADRSILDFEAGLPTRKIAIKLVGERPAAMSGAEYEERLNKKIKHLQNVLTKKLADDAASFYDGLASKENPHGKTKPEWRWWLDMAFAHHSTLHAHSNRHSSTLRDAPNGRDADQVFDNKEHSDTPIAERAWSVH